MQSLIRSKSAGVTGGRGTAGPGAGRDLLVTYWGSRFWGVVGDDPVELEWHRSPEYRLLDLRLPHQVKPVRTPVAIFGSLGVCIYGPASRHWLISYSPIHLT